MNVEFFENLEAMRYWEPDKSSGVQADILNNPDKYSDYIGSFKKDGEWAKVIIEEDKVLIQSRSISKKTGKYTEKQDSLPHLINEFNKLPKNTVLVGEICYDELYKRSKDVGSILRSLVPLALEKQEKEEDKLHFYCFDVLCWDDVEVFNKPFDERIAYVVKAKLILESSPYTRFAEYKTIERVIDEYPDYLAKGGEGFVLQKKDNPYTPGKRKAWATVKLKKHTEEIELPVVGVIEPEKVYTGKELSTWTYFEGDTPVTKYYFNRWKSGVVVDFNGTLVYAASGCTDEDAQYLATDIAQELIRNHKLYAVIRGMEIERDTGSIRHPVLVRLREDI